RVTGERWPVPALHAHVPRPAPPPSSDNSKKNSGQSWLRVIVDRWEHQRPRNDQSSPAPPAAWGLALRLAGGGTLAAGRPLGSALSRTWWPAAIPAALAVRKLRL